MVEPNGSDMTPDASQAQGKNLSIDIEMPRGRRNDTKPKKPTKAEKLRTERTNELLNIKSMKPFEQMMLDLVRNQYEHKKILQYRTAQNLSSLITGDGKNKMTQVAKRLALTTKKEPPAIKRRLNQLEEQVKDLEPKINEFISTKTELKIRGFFDQL